MVKTAVDFRAVEARGVVRQVFGRAEFRRVKDVLPGVRPAGGAEVEVGVKVHAGKWKKRLPAAAQLLRGKMRLNFYGVSIHALIDPLLFGCIPG